MTLAVILLIGVSWMGPAVQAGTNATDQSTPPTATPQIQEVPPPTPAPENKQESNQAPPPSTAKKSSTAHSHSTAKKPVHKKKAATSTCDPASPSTTSTAANDPAGTSPPSKTGTSTPTQNCPPSKTIVRHGGTSEPSIQLAGGPGGDQASQERDATTQMIGITEANLKRLAGQQLSAEKQTSVTQIREFLEQSKSALAAEEIERARTLAWKAELLSEDLLKPEK